MNIAVWNLPPAELMASGFGSGASAERFEVLTLPVAGCERALREARVDAALLPTLSVLKHHKDFDVVPAVALSTWSYPFARLQIDHDLSKPVRRLAHNPVWEQERFVTEVILREHYRMEPEFVTVASAEDLHAANADARLFVGPDVPTALLEGRVLDLGQEWFELANYPMTWGLFAARRDELTPEMIREIRDAVRQSERQRKVWLRARETLSELHEFYADALRFRLDDLCVAGLTELRQYLFYYDVVDDVRDIPFVFIPDDEDEEGPGSKPLL